jgi:hypothetical protein
VWPTLTLIMAVASAAALVYQAWVLSRVRQQLASSTREVDALRGQLAVLSARWESLANEWQAERMALHNAMSRQTADYHDALDVMRGVLSRSDVPAHVAGEYAQRVLATGPRDAPRISAGRDGAALPPITRPPPRTTPSGGGR